MARPVVFLSDYGLEDGFVGACHAVIARISAESHVVDLTHAVPAHDIFRGALLLHDAVPSDMRTGVASRGPHSAFGRAQTLTDNLDADPSADVAVDPKGNAVVIWADAAGMHAAARPAGRRRFSHAKIISQTQADPEVANGSRESASAAWVAGRDGDWSVRASTADGGASFGRATALPLRGLAGAKPVVAVDGRSAVTAAWATRGRVMAATCSAAGHCGRPRALSPGPS